MLCMNHPVTLHLTIRVNDSVKFIDFLRRALPFYEAPGGITVRLLQKFDDPRSFIEIVEYRDKSTYDQDQQRVQSHPEMQDYLQAWRGLLAAPATIESYYDITDQLHS